VLEKAVKQVIPYGSLSITQPGAASQRTLTFIHSNKDEFDKNVGITNQTASDIHNFSFKIKQAIEVQKDANGNYYSASPLQTFTRDDDQTEVNFGKFSTIVVKNGATVVIPAVVENKINLDGISWFTD
jgi:hypothetical protein